MTAKDQNTARVRGCAYASHMRRRLLRGLHCQLKEAVCGDQRETGATPEHRPHRLFSPASGTYTIWCTTRFELVDAVCGQRRWLAAGWRCTHNHHAPREFVGQKNTHLLWRSRAGAVDPACVTQSHWYIPATAMTSPQQCTHWLYHDIDPNQRYTTAATHQYIQLDNIVATFDMRPIQIWAALEEEHGRGWHGGNTP